MGTKHIHSLQKFPHHLINHLERGLSWLILFFVVVGTVLLLLVYGSCKLPKRPFRCLRKQIFEIWMDEYRCLLIVLHFPHAFWKCNHIHIFILYNHESEALPIQCESFFLFSVNFVIWQLTFYINLIMEHSNEFAFWLLLGRVFIHVFQLYTCM